MKPTLLLTGPADLLAAVPYLIGFHPADSMVVIGSAGEELRLSARWDLPLAPDRIGRIVPVLRREGVTAVILAGYGPERLVTPAVGTVTGLLARAGIRVAEALRAESGRYWTYSCPGLGCHPAEGIPYDPFSSRVAAEAVLHGLVALPDRQSLLRSLEPSGGAAMRRITGRVVRELRARLTETALRDDGFAAAFVADGLARVRDAVRRYGSGGRLTDHEVARLGLDLAVIRIRDEAWALIDDSDAHVTLWRDVTRRLEPGFAAPAASLLAAASWWRGDGVLAGVAVERALAADPGYSMAILLRQAVTGLVPPAVFRGRMPTPGDLDREMGPPRASWLLPLHRLLARAQPGAAR